MSQFDANFREIGVPALNEQLGSTVAYLEPDDEVSGGTECVMIVSSERSEDVQDGRGRCRRRTRTATVSQGSGGIASPNEAGRVVIGGEVWQVDFVEAESGNMARLHLCINERMERSRQGLRNA